MTRTCLMRDSGQFIGLSETILTKVFWGIGLISEKKLTFLKSQF